MKFNGVEVPDHGGIITKEGDGFVIPDKPIIPFIEGDGTGRDIWKASRMVFDAAVQKVQRTEQRRSMRTRTSSTPAVSSCRDA